MLAGQTEADADRALELSEYRVLEQLCSRYASRDELDADLEARVAPSEVQWLYVDWLLYANNVVLRADYRELLFGGPQ